MPVVLFDGASHQRDDGETVLAALLRGGIAAPHSCKAGACGSCMLRAVEGDLGANSQAGLKDTWKAQGYFLPCVCVPRGDLTVASLDAGMAAVSKALAIDNLSDNVIRLRLSRPDNFDFRAGQYLSLQNASGLARSYSIASLPSDGVIDLQIRIYPNGRMSDWIANHAAPGDVVTLYVWQTKTGALVGRFNKVELPDGTTMRDTQTGADDGGRADTGQRN